MIIFNNYLNKIINKTSSDGYPSIYQLKYANAKIRNYCIHVSLVYLLSLVDLKLNRLY